MQRVMAFGLGVAGLMLLGGCADEQKLCVPGQQNMCLCPGGGASFQTCNGAGSGYDPCQCFVGGQDAGPTDPGPPAETKQADPGPAPDPGPDTGTCLPQYFKGCVGTEAWWFDSCEQADEYIENCPKQCSNGACVEFCDPKAYEDCNGDDVWWFDSCGVAESLSKPCDPEQFCNNKTCIKPFYSGTWRVTADPDTKPSIGATFPPVNLSLSVSGTAATASLTVQGITVDYVGTITGKQLYLEANYTGPSDDIHDETWDVTFVDLNTFEGTIVDNISYPGIGSLGSVVWNVTGVKQ